MLRRFLSIKNFRCFDNFKWNTGTNFFNKYNIIFGWNGSGKTTLCDFFSCIEDDTVPSNCEFEFRFQDKLDQPEKIATQRKPIDDLKCIKVFNQKNIDKVVNQDLSHIVILGIKANELAEELNKLSKTYLEQNEEIIKIKVQLALENNKIDDFARESAKNIKTAAQRNNSYDINWFKNRINNHNKKVLLDKEYDSLFVSIRSEKKDEIIFTIPKLELDPLLHEIESLIIENPTYKAIESFNDNQDLKIWAEKGVQLHKENSSVCFFCKNPIQPERWDELNAYFSDSLTNLCSRIDGTIIKLKQCKNVYQNINFPDKARFYKEFESEYEVAKLLAQKTISSIIEYLENLTNLLRKKKENVFKNLLPELKLISLVNDYSSFIQLNDIIKKHSDKSATYTKYIEISKKGIEEHLLSIAKDKYDSLLADKRKIEGDSINIINNNQSIKIKIDELSANIKDARVPAKVINAAIKTIFGHSELFFEYKDNGYKIMRGTEVAQNLSTGEKNAIALIYFFNSLNDSNINKKDCIVILDDPISSFDNNFYYGAIAYMREMLADVNQTIIFTHKFNLYKDLSRLFPKNTEKYLLEKKKGSPVLENEDSFLRDYQDEYAYLFKQIYNFNKETPHGIEEYLPYPNIARRLLESFLAFKVPSCKNDSEQNGILEKALKLEGDNKDNYSRIRAITRLLQNHSHAKTISSTEQCEEVLLIKELPNILRELLEFIKYHDEVHYTVLAKQVDPNFGVTPQIISFPEIRTIPLFYDVVSAGTGNLLSDEEFEYIETANSEADCALRVSGDSMQPQIKDKDIILIKKQDDIENSEIGIVLYEGQGYVKKLIKNPPMLVSLNKDKYPPIQITSDLKIFGKVIAVLNQNNVEVLKKKYDDLHEWSLIKSDDEVSS